MPLPEYPNLPEFYKKGNNSDEMNKVFLEMLARRIRDEKTQFEIEFEQSDLGKSLQNEWHDYWNQDDKNNT